MVAIRPPRVAHVRRPSDPGLVSRRGLGRSAIIEGVSVDPTTILSASGPIAVALGADFESRPEQIEMAAAVAQAMETKTHLLVEAGTGVGKSYAYLVPAILRACLNGETVVIATNTIALQEQLVQKDIPVLREALEAAGVIPRGRDEGTAGLGDAGEEEDLATDGARALRAVLVKGRGNYVSIRRLKMASERQSRLFGDPAARRSLHVIEDWASATLEGSLSTLPAGGLERPGVWDKVQSDAGNCMGRRCPTYKTCFYQSARREMEGANLLVTNHALFFSDLALRANDTGFLPAYQHVVLDEAHNAEDVAADHFGISLSEGRVMHLLTTLYHARTGKGYLPQLQSVTGDAEGVDRAVRLVLAAENASRAFFESLVAFQRQSRTGRIREAGVVENVLTLAMRDLSLRLKALKEKIPSEPGAKGEADRFELNAYAGRAEEMAAEAEALVKQSLPGCAYWVEVRGDEEERGGRFGVKATLACSPIEVAPLLKEHLFSKEHSVVLTSATMAVGGRHKGTEARRHEEGKKADTFGHAMARLGCEGAATLMLGSPFDHAAQVELHIERSMQRPAGKGRASSNSTDEFDQRPPEERASSGAAVIRRGGDAPAHGTYNGDLAARILTHIEATGGGAFVLFTSFATLYGVADLLGPQLEDRGLPMLVQGRGGPRSVILQQFRDNENSVLLGAASFWQGVDVRGRGLRNVIITKLPFDPPDRPLTEARNELIKSRGGDPFRDDSLPRAVIKFKQGFGRLIRSKTDTGRVVVLDPRIVTTGYGQRFLDALPEGVRVIDR